MLDGLTGSVSVAQAECLQLALHSCDDMARQIEGLSDSSLVEAGELEVKLVAADIAQVVEVAAASFRPSMAEHGIRLLTEIPVALPMALIKVTDGAADNPCLPLP